MHVLAYLDPGSGSMVLQMLLGGIASAAVAVKMFGKQIWSTIAFWKKDDDAPGAKPAAAVDTEKDPA
ncbi:MAG: hypothetical protein QOG09_25 [Solirubrobacterales bacterium]|jgi:hypothetical protein|nr:hypothetical protein [Solirubrobacterales bacterium]MDX6653135.1 hypothetical protein [Solirubrobacterales bacterium]MDX6661923.1 hypothetical protein [Solirubrobacterales bacterium]